MLKKSASECGKGVSSRRVSSRGWGGFGPLSTLPSSEVKQEGQPSSNVLGSTFKNEKMRRFRSHERGVRASEGKRGKGESKGGFGITEKKKTRFRGKRNASRTIMRSRCHSSFLKPNKIARKINI